MEPNKPREGTRFNVNLLHRSLMLPWSLHFTKLLTLNWNDMRCWVDSVYLILFYFFQIFFYAAFWWLYVSIFRPLECIMNLTWSEWNSVTKILCIFFLFRRVSLENVLLFVDVQYQWARSGYFFHFFFSSYGVIYLCTKETLMNFYRVCMWLLFAMRMCILLILSCIHL